MPGHEIVVVGSTAGGIHPLLPMVSALRGDLSTALFAVHTFYPQTVTAPPAILGRTLSRAVLRADIAGVRQSSVGTGAAA